MNGLKPFSVKTTLDICLTDAILLLAIHAFDAEGAVEAADSLKERGLLQDHPDGLAKALPTPQGEDLVRQLRELIAKRCGDWDASEGQ